MECSAVNCDSVTKPVFPQDNSAAHALFRAFAAV